MLSDKPIVKKVKEITKIAITGLTPISYGDVMWFGKNKFERETRTDRRDQRDNEHFNITKALVLKIKHRQHIKRRDAATPNQRDPKEKLQPDGRPDDFSQIARGDGDFAKDPEKPCDRP